MKDFQKISVLAGFDAFVDRIFHLVRRRYALDDYERMETMQEFSNRIAAASGHSANVERVLQRTSAGGNATVFARCAAGLGARVEVLAPFGEPFIHPVFQMEVSNIHLHSLGNPGFTDALEFRDGKLMLNEMGGVAQIGIPEIYESVGESIWQKLLRQSDVVMLGNWTMNLGMKSIFDYFTDS